MFQQYRTIRDFDLYQEEQNFFFTFTNFKFKKQTNVPETQDNQLETPILKFNTLSLKLKNSSTLTSFHKKSLDQHITSFQKNILHYLNNSYPQLKNISKETIYENVFGSDPNQYQNQEKLKDIIIKDNIYFEQREKYQFLTDLFYEQNLDEFLLYICNNTHGSIGTELVFIGNYFWQVYVKKQQNGMSLNQIQKLVDESLQKEKFKKIRQKLQFLNFNKALMIPEVEQNRLWNNLQQFLRVYGITILLVIEEYFINSYINEQKMRGIQNIRSQYNFLDIQNEQYSDDENEYHFYCGCKKIKQ